jgi:hypothetical protein
MRADGGRGPRRIEVKSLSSSEMVLLLYLRIASILVTWRRRSGLRTDGNGRRSGQNFQDALMWNRNPTLASYQLPGTEMSDRQSWDASGRLV